MTTEADMTEAFRDHWDSWQHNQPLLTERNGERQVHMFLEVNGGRLQVLLVARIGARNGIKLLAWVYDPQPVILTDRIVEYGRTEVGLPATPLDLRNLRGRAYHQHLDAAEVCYAAFQELAQEVQRRPDYYEKSFRAIRVLSRSIIGLPAGTPTLSKRAH